jgi:lipopolysaccharide export system permease protein
MLFQSSFRKELAKNFAGILIILITIVMTMMLIRVLGLASKGQVNPADILLVMAYFVLGHMPTILTLCLLISVVHTLTRMYKDSEMIIWQTSGKGARSLISPLFGFAWPILIAIFGLALVIWPWANTQSQTLRDQYERRGDLERVTPGVFQESSDGSRVFYIDKNSTAVGKSNDIFVYENRGGSESIVTAKSGHLESLKTGQFLVLTDGQRITLSAQKATIDFSTFKKYGNLIKSNTFNPLDDVPTKTISSLNLINDPKDENLGELAWRLSLVLAAFNFIVIGVALSTNTSPRTSRNQSYVLALFAFLIYYNLINIGQTRISDGRSNFYLWLLGLHGITFLMGASWLMFNHLNLNLRRLTHLLINLLSSKINKKAKA